MSSSEEKKNSKSRAHALAAWEWFKEAAWLQVLLIVAVVVGLVISIPFIVNAIVSALNSDDSDFYKQHRINYATYEKYIAGDDSYASGTIGKGSEDGTFDDGTNNGLNGFVVMFYDETSSECDNIQKKMETWYNTFNKDYSSSNLKFFTVDCTWVVDDEDDATSYKGQVDKYDNNFISLEQQEAVREYIIPTYSSQQDDSIHYNSSVTIETLEKKLITSKTDSSNLTTPLFLTFSKTSSEKEYTLNKVIFSNVGSLSTDQDGVSKMMLDIFNFQIVTQ